MWSLEELIQTLGSEWNRWTAQTGPYSSCQVVPLQVRQPLTGFDSHLWILTKRLVARGLSVSVRTAHLFLSDRMSHCLSSSSDCWNETFQHITSLKAEATVAFKIALFVATRQPLYMLWVWISRSALFSILWHFSFFLSLLYFVLSALRKWVTH